MELAVNRPLRMIVALGAALLLAALATPALAHGDSDHSHSGDFEDADFLDPMIWDGTASVDCRAAAEGTIVWTLTGSDGVEYAELHIDEPESSIVRRTGGPYVWISPLYALDEIEADVDRIVGVLDDGARVDAVTCPEGGDSNELAGLALPVGGGVIAGAVLGLLVGSRRRSA